MSTEMTLLKSTVDRFLNYFLSNRLIRPCLYITECFNRRGHDGLYRQLPDFQKNILQIIYGKS